MSLFAPLTFLYLLPTKHPFFYPSDIPSILFFTSGLVCLRRGNWFVYYPVYALGTFNRETTCFLTIAYFLVFCSRRTFKTVAAHVFLQFLIWASIKTILYQWFRGNMGEGLFEKTHFFSNLEYLSRITNYPYLLGGIGFLLIPTLVFSGLINDDFVRRAVWVSIPFVVGMIFVSNIFELRIYGELVPILLPAFLLILKAMFEKEALTVEARRVPGGFEDSSVRCRSPRSDPSFPRRGPGEG